MNALTIQVPDFTPDEYARFDANDRLAEKAACWAEPACADAGPFPATHVAVPEIELSCLPF